MGCFKVGEGGHRRRRSRHVHWQERVAAPQRERNGPGALGHRPRRGQLRRCGQDCGRYSIAKKGGAYRESVIFGTWLVPHQDVGNTNSFNVGNCTHRRYKNAAQTNPGGFDRPDRDAWRWLGLPSDHVANDVSDPVWVGRGVDLGQSPRRCCGWSLYQSRLPGLCQRWWVNARKHDDRGRLRHGTDPAGWSRSRIGTHTGRTARPVWDRCVEPADDGQRCLGP